MENIVKLYTDGSCNNHIGGYAVVLEGLESKDEIPAKQNHLVKCGNKNYTTNNEMELMGIQVAVEFAKEITKADKIIILSDSEYSVKSCTVWYKNWQRNGWRTSSRKPVQNQELIKSIIHILEENPQIELQHVKGHDGNKWNEFADKMANQARQAFEEEEGGENPSSSECDMYSELFNKLGALHGYEIENKYVIAFKNINVETVKALKNMGFKNIKIAGVWKENFGENKGEYIEVVCNKGD